MGARVGGQVWTWDGATGGSVRGVCAGCGREVAAIGLVWIPPHRLFGREVEGGWFCSGCRPGVFGRVRGERAVGWETEVPIRRDRGLRAMGTLDALVGRRDMRPRIRKPAAMRALDLGLGHVTQG